MIVDDEMFIVKASPDERFMMVDESFYLPNGEEWEMYEDELPEQLFTHTPKKDRRPIGDCMFTAYGLVISDRANDQIRELRICPTVSWVPVEVNNTRTNDKHTYWLADRVRAEEHDVLDYTRSEYSYFPDTEIIQTVSKWVLDNTELPEFDMFFSTHNRWLTTKSFRDTCEKHGLEGFEFRPVQVWHD